MGPRRLPLLLGLALCVAVATAQDFSLADVTALADGVEIDVNALFNSVGGLQNDASLPLNVLDNIRDIGLPRIGLGNSQTDRTLAAFANQIRELGDTVSDLLARAERVRDLSDSSGDLLREVANSIADSIQDSNQQKMDLGALAMRVNNVGTNYVQKMNDVDNDLKGDFLSKVSASNSIFEYVESSPGRRCEWGVGTLKAGQAMTADFVFPFQTTPSVALTLSGFETRLDKGRPINHHLNKYHDSHHGHPHHPHHHPNPIHSNPHLNPGLHHIPYHPAFPHPSHFPHHPTPAPPGPPGPPGHPGPPGPPPPGTAGRKRRQAPGPAPGPVTPKPPRHNPHHPAPHYTLSLDKYVTSITPTGFSLKFKDNSTGLIEGMRVHCSYMACEGIGARELPTRPTLVKSDLRILMHDDNMMMRR